MRDCKASVCLAPTHDMMPFRMYKTRETNRDPITLVIGSLRDGIASIATRGKSRGEAFLSLSVGGSISLFASEMELTE